MRVSGRLRAERTRQQQLARRVRDVVLAAQHVRDAHRGIVDDVAEQECGRAIGPSNDEITQLVGQEALRSADQVLVQHLLARRDAKAQRGHLPPAFARAARRGVERGASAGVAWRMAAAERGLARHLELEWRAVARVRPARGLELLPRGGIERAALRLAVRARTIRAIGPRVPVEAEPRQFRAERRDLGFVGARTIGVLDPEHETPAEAARVQPVEKRGARIAEVQCAGRTGREAGGNLGRHRHEV